MEAATQITEYNDFRAQLAQLKDQNDSLVFDYETDDGETAARQHVYKIRRTKGAVETVRKELKASVLERGRSIDGEAKAITAELDGMIDVHMEPIREKQAREEARVKALDDRLDELRSFGSQVMQHGKSSADLTNLRAHVFDNYAPDESWQERQAEAAQVYVMTLKSLEVLIREAKVREDEAAELAMLREQAAKLAEQEKAAEDAEARAEREAAEAAERAEAALETAKQLAHNEEARLEQHDSAAAAEIEWRKQCHTEIAASLKKHGFEREAAIKIIRLIATNQVARVSINYARGA